MKRTTYHPLAMLDTNEYECKGTKKESRPAIAWWKIIGPETRVSISWRNELKYFSIYSISSVSFSFIGILGLLRILKCANFEAFLLFIISITSFQSDVIYLGIDTHWRTLDTILSCFFISYYAICDTLLLLGESGGTSISIQTDPWWRHLLAWFVLIANLFFFIRSQCATSFKIREMYHILWHFGLCLGMVILKF